MITLYGDAYLVIAQTSVHPQKLELMLMKKDHTLR